MSYDVNGCNRPTPEKLAALRREQSRKNASLSCEIAEILRLERDGNEFWIPAEPGPLGPFEGIREAAKELMAFNDRMIEKDRNEIERLRDALLAAERRGAWIKVTERMPDIGEEVLFNAPMCYGVEIGRYCEDGIWRTSRYGSDGTECKFWPKEVNFWQPLPPAPEERG